MNYHSSPPAQNISPDLSGLQRRLVKNHKWIWISTAIFLLIAIAWLAFAKPVYTARAAMQIGQVNTFTPNGFLSQPLDTMQDINARIRAAHPMLNGTLLGNARYPVIHSMSTPSPKIPSTIFSIAVYARTAAEAESFAKQIMLPIIQQHENTYKTTMSLYDARIKALAQNQQRVAEQSRQLARQIPALRTREPVLAALLSNEAARLTSEAAQYENSLHELRQQKLSVLNKPSKLLFLTANPAPVYPNPRLTLVGLTLTGLIVGVVLALMRAACGSKTGTT